jgi:flagellar biosynthesis/type III secretory pathway protein FliH
MNKFFSLATGLMLTLVGTAQNDPQSCYNESSAVYYCTQVGVNDGYEDGYNDGLAAGCDSCSTTCDYSYYLNVIANFETATAELMATIAQLNDSINGLEGTIAQQAQVLNITQFALDNCFDDNNALDATIDNQQTYIDQLLAELDSQQAVIITLTTSLDECTGDLTSCETTNADLIDAYNELGDDYVDAVGTIDSLETDIAACDATAEVWQTAAEFYADSLASTLTILDAIKLELSDCYDGAEWNFNMVQDLTAEVESLEALVDALMNQLEVNAAEAADLVAIYLNTISILEGQLDECGDTNQDLVNANLQILNELETCEDETLYWMDAYADIVYACDSATSALQDALESKTCDEEYAAGFADGQSVGYDDGYEHGVNSVECPEYSCDYNYGDIMEAFYNGYDLGLGDCDGTTGIDILDPSGNVLTQVTGYFNELGQVIDPRTYEGVVIRRHADGTFSKYYVQR